MPPIHVRFRRFTSLNTTIRLREGEIFVSLSDLLEGAPDSVHHAIAHILLANIKGRDVAARYGGEEFAVLLPETSLSGATALGQQICSLVAHGHIKRSDGQAIVGEVTVSIGVAVARETELLETVVERADAAMYCAKRAGRNRVEAAP